ncbi:MAG: ABC-2 transporter permease [Clostridia bacterium]|nr:ABC-2 transporter permease [Clostridia bacterium]
MKGLIKKELRSLRVFTVMPMFGILSTSLIFLLLNFEKDLSYAISYGCLASISYTWAVEGASTDAGNGWLGWIGVLPVSKEQYFKAKSIGAAVAVSLVLLPQWISLAIRFCTDDDLTPLGLIPMYLALLSKAVTTVADCLPPPIYTGKSRRLWTVLTIISWVLPFGNILLAHLLIQSPDELLFWVLLLLQVSACLVLTFATVKNKAELFEGYQLGIPRELQIMTPRK